MSPQLMRQKVAAAYSGDKWQNRVKNMSEGQVYAIYVRLVAQNKI